MSRRNALILVKVISRSRSFPRSNYSVAGDHVGDYANISSIDNIVVASLNKCIYLCNGLHTIYSNDKPKIVTTVILG